VEGVPVAIKPVVRLFQHACEYIGLPWNGGKVDMVRASRAKPGFEIRRRLSRISTGRIVANPDITPVLG
jgi:hypothetical protein